MSASLLGAWSAVVKAEWRLLLRNRVAVAGVALMVLLTLAAALVSHEQTRQTRDERAHFQGAADRQWADQPDRHPHRVVHYGHYIFRPLAPLASFDAGVSAITGNTLYLEGHRQNSANFSDASQASILLRFGQLTPAYVLQVLSPLLVIFLAFGTVAREREEGQLRLLMGNGMRGIVLVWGKLAAHGAIALLLAAPAFVALGLVGVMHPELGWRVLGMTAGYSMYLLLWVLVTVLVSTAVARSRDALLVLVGCWIVTVIFLPRIMPDVASASIVQSTRIETEVAIHKALAKLGDSHNPDDPHFRQFKEKTLKAYGVARVEDLPVNYGGLLMAEGERLTSELFEQTMLADYKRQSGQSAIVHGAAFASPVIALRRLSASLANTDFDGHSRFLLEGERYRFALIQALNRLHTNEVRYHNDKDQRITKDHWRSMPRFDLKPAPLASVTARHVWPAIAVLAGWLVLLSLVATLLGARLERSAK